MSDTFTTARFRELADEMERHMSALHDETAAALRAAADRIELTTHMLGNGISALAAREALLFRCEPYILACATWPDPVAHGEARALAAEIAEALQEKDNG